MIIEAQHIHKFYHGVQVLRDVSVTMEDRDRVGLIGANGSGKSTLLEILTGRELPDHLQEGDGEIQVSRKATIGYLPQMGGLTGDNTVWDEMRGVFQPLLDAQDQLHTLEARMEQGDMTCAEEYHTLQTWFETNEGYQIDVKIRTVLGGMGFDAETYQRPISSFSGGEKTRLALSKLLLESPNLLILDEPTNHLDFKAVMWLEDYLKEYPGALLVVSHDRYFLDQLCSTIWELEQGKLTHFKGNYTTYTKLKEELVAQQWKAYNQQQKEIAKLEEYIAKNGVRASTAKSAQSRVKQLDKIERLEKPLTPPKQAKVEFQYTVEPPEDIVTVQHVDVAVGEGSARRILVPDVSMDVHKGEKWGIIGDNGVGKSTFLKILQGTLPHTGKIRWGGNIKISYFDQEGANLHPNMTVMEEIHHRMPAWTDQEVRSFLGRVRLTGDNVFKPVGVLSGGERAKVSFAVMMLEKGNVLLLDEPTNHLDIAMKEIIEDALVAFPTLLFVSHDRYLLDKVANHILELTPQKATVYVGGFSAWAEAKKAAEAEAMEQAKPEKPVSTSHRTKKQRAQYTQMRTHYRTLEQKLDDMQQELDQLTTETTQPEVVSDYVLLQEKCNRMETLRQDMDTTMEEMIELEEAMDADSTLNS